MKLTTVFLDRDDTINVGAAEGDYITKPDQLVLLDGAGDAIRALNEADIKVVVVTNQRAIARGLMSPQDYVDVTDRLGSLLADHGAKVDAVYCCPHEYDACTCRKPLPGLLHQAMDNDRSIVPEHSMIIGDRTTDVETGAAIGIPGILLSANGPRTLKEAVTQLLTGNTRLPRS